MSYYLERTNEQRMDEVTNGRTDGRMDGRTNGRTNGRAGRNLY